jgi:trimeric autotransporter adhesin
MASRYGRYPTLGGGVASVNSATGAINILPGTNISINTVGNNITINSTGGGGSVTSVTASSPLASSGGATPNISFTGVLPIANGGTGQTTANAALSALTTSGTQTMNDGGTISSSYSYLQLTGGTGGTPTVITSYATGSSTGFQASLSSSFYGAMTFTSPVTASMTAMTAHLQTTGSGTASGTINAYLYATSSGAPLTHLVTSTNSFNVSAITNTPAAFTFNFAPYALVNGTVYAFVIDYTAVTFTAGEAIAMISDPSSSYVGGNCYYSNNAGATWFSLSSYGMVFEVDGPGTVTTSAVTAITAGSTTGQSLTLQIMGANDIIIKNAAVTRLKGNADVTTQPSDTMQLIWDGTNWTQTGGSTNN